MTPVAVQAHRDIAPFDNDMLPWRPLLGPLEKKKQRARMKHPNSLLIFWWSHRGSNPSFRRERPQKSIFPLFTSLSLIVVNIL
jgi:hypothetical protein